MRKIVLTCVLLALIPLATFAAGSNQKPTKQKPAQTSTGGCCGGCCAKPQAH